MGYASFREDIVDRYVEEPITRSWNTPSKGKHSGKKQLSVLTVKREIVTWEVLCYVTAKHRQARIIVKAFADVPKDEIVRWFKAEYPEYKFINCRVRQLPAPGPTKPK